MRAKAMSSMGPACAAAVLVLAGSSGAVHAEPLGCRRAVAWDVASDLVAYELPRECERKESSAAEKKSVFELRRISTGATVDIADCEISYTLGADGPVGHPCDLDVLLHDRKPFTRLKPSRRGKLLTEVEAAEIAAARVLWLPGGESGNVRVDLASFGVSPGEVRATDSHVLVVLAGPSLIQSGATVETLVRLPRAERAGGRPQQDLIAQAGALATLTTGALAPTFLRAARTWGPLDVGAVSKTFCGALDVVERLESWRRVALELPPGESASLETALAAKGCYAALDPATYDAAGPSMRVALEWLEALRNHERAAAVELMEAPFAARGWWDNRAADQAVVACGVKNRARPKAWPSTAFQVDDPKALRSVVDCLLEAADVPRRLPPLVNGRWPPDRGNPWDHEVGTIYPIEPSKVSKRVRRFAAEARDAARGATLLQAVAVDNDGFTLTMLLVVADERVRAIFAADDFEE